MKLICEHRVILRCSSMLKAYPIIRSTVSVQAIIEQSMQPTITEV